MSPSSEMVINGTNMSTAWKVRAAVTSTWPSPSVEVIISARNTTMHEMTRPMRQPVKMEGIAAGSTTFHNTSRGGVPAASADQTNFCSTMVAP